MSYYDDSEDDLTAHLPSSRRVRFHDLDEDPDTASSDRDPYYREDYRRRPRSPSPPPPPGALTDQPAHDAESLSEHEAERPRPIRHASDSSIRDHSQERVRIPSRQTPDPPPPRRRTSGYFSAHDVFPRPLEDRLNPSAYVDRRREKVASPEFFSPVSPYEAADDRRWAPRPPPVITPRDERFERENIVHGPYRHPSYPGWDRGSDLRDREDQIWSRLRTIRHEIQRTQLFLREARAQRHESELRRAQEILMRQEQLLALQSNKARCEEELAEHKDRARSFDDIEARLQSLTLQEEDLLRKQQEAQANHHEGVQDDGDALLQDGATQFVDLADQLLIVQSNTAAAQDELRSAQFSRDLARAASREISYLEEQIKEVRYKEANARIAAQGAQDDGLGHEDALTRRLEVQIQEEQDLILSLETRHRERIEVGQKPHYLKPEQQVVVRARSRDHRGSSSSSSFYGTEENWGSSSSSSDDPIIIRSSRQRGQPVIINNRIYNDHSSEDETVTSSGSGSDRDQYRSSRTYKAVEKDGLSMSFPLNKGPIYPQDVRSEDAAAPTPAAIAWKEDKTYIPGEDGKSTITTELKVIHAAEYSEDETGIGKTILMCLDGPRANEGSQNAQMRWLHIQQKNLKFKTLEEMVSDCFLLENDLKSVAFCAIEKVKEQFQGESECGAYLAPGSILRYIGEREHAKEKTADSRYTEPVVFLSCPFPALQPFKNERGSKFEHRPRSLLQSLYGYDVGSERETGQVVQKLGIVKSRKEVLHINQLWCLKIGSKILITMSEQSAAQLCGHNILVNPRDANMKEPLLVRLTDLDEREYRMVVERDCNYVDFLTLAVARVAGSDADASRWDIFDEEDEVLTPNQWIDILGSNETNILSVSVLERQIDDSGCGASMQDTSECYPQKPARIRSASRSTSHARRAIRSTSRSISRRRARSENDLRRRDSRPRRFYDGDTHSGLVVANRNCSRPRSYDPGSSSWYSRNSPSYLSSSHGPLVRIPRRKTGEPAYQPPLNEETGALVLYGRRHRQGTGYIKSNSGPDRSIRNNNLNASATKISHGPPEVRHTDPTDSESPTRFYAGPEGFVQDEAATVLQDHDWGHLSDIPEERSSSAPTPKVGASKGRSDSSSSSSEEEADAYENDMNAAATSKTNPLNMQLILRPKDFGETSVTAGQAASSKDSDLEIDISEPWRNLLGNTVSEGDELGHAGPSGAGQRFSTLEDLKHSKDGPPEKPAGASSRVAGGNEETTEEPTRPVTATPDTLRTAGANLHALYILLATALRLEDHARAANVQYNQIPDQELDIQTILQGAALPAEWETKRDLQAAVCSIEEIRKRQNSTAEVVKEADDSLAIIHQEKIIRRLQLIDMARGSSTFSEVDLKVTRARYELEELRSMLRDANSAGNHSEAADLMYWNIPEKQAELQGLIPTEERLLDWDTVLDWAHGRGQFIWGFGPDHTASNNKGQHTGLSQDYILRTDKDSLYNNERFHQSHYGRDQGHDDPPYHYTSRTADAPSRSRHQRSPSISPESASQLSGSYLSDDATLAPGVILNEKPRAQRPMPEVYDPEEVTRRFFPEEPIDGDSETSSLLKAEADESRQSKAGGVAEKADVQSHNTSKFSTRPTVTEFSLWTSAEKARTFRRWVLRRYGPTTDNDSSRIEIAGGISEQVEDEEADGTFDKGCRAFYRRHPKPPPGKEVDWMDEYVLDFRDLPFVERSMFTLPITWPPLPVAFAEPIKARTTSSDPFLRWRVKTSEEHRTPEEVDKSVLRILKNVDESLLTGGFRDMYPNSFMCTLKELYERHDFLISLSTPDPVLEEIPAGESDGQVKGQSSVGEGTISGDKEKRDDVNGSQSPLDKAAVPEQGARDEHASYDRSHPGGAQSVNAHAHEQAVLKNLLEVSRALLAAYLPAEGSPLFNSVSRHFWGCVDEIFRQVTWQMTQSSRGYGMVAYIIRDFDFPSNIIERAHQAPNQKESWSSCRDCRGGRHYETVLDALKHLHADHFDCSNNIKEPYDDPCYVWVRQLNGERVSSGLAHLHLASVEDLIDHLLLISQRSKELHNLVASLHGSDAKLLPKLPPQIVLAFEQIMGMYMAQARRLSLSNLRTTRSSVKLPPQRIEISVDRARRRGEQARLAVMDHLTEAKKNILRGTTRQTDSLSVEAVGVEFLILSLITNLQNRPALNRPGPHNPDKADFVEFYRRYTSELRFKANRRPKKRVFLDIHGLEEELDALHGMVTAQLSLNCSYLRLLDPGSTRATNTTRIGQFRVERAYIRKQQKNLDHRVEDIHALRGKAEVLKEQVKKTIEILEEDHGKAIRVFTFVTLLFLPLSFVTSFMGMNTTDIRDTEWSQRIFWATGLPVTLAVVILALIYAYRGERIQDWILTGMRSRKKRAGRDVGGSFAWSGEVPEGDTFLLRGGARRTEVVRLEGRGTIGSSFPPRRDPAWIGVKERLRSKRKSQTAPASGIRRRRTGESLARGTM